MEKIFFLIIAVAAFAIVYASNRCYVKHFCDAQFSSRRGNSYWQLLAAIFLMAFMAYFSTSDILITYATLLLVIFGFFTMLKVVKHRKYAGMQGISLGAKRYHLSIVRDYIRWYFMAAGLIILSTIVLVIFQTMI